MTDSDWPASDGSGFGRPLHQWVWAAIDAEAASQRARQAFGRALAAGDALDVTFGDDQEGVHLLGNGWSSPEPWGTWSSSHRAEILLPAGAAGRSIVIRGHVYAPTGKVRLECAIDGQVQRHVVDADVDVAIALALPAEMGHGPDTVTLDLPDAVSPSSFGASSDGRLLGFGISHLRIE